MESVPDLIKSALLGGKFQGARKKETRPTQMPYIYIPDLLLFLD